MKIGGIICEYNPFHNGHEYHIKKTRENGATHIICAMNGNFVQRGDCAVADKWTRAKAAVVSGADLVVEIPTPWACSSAENFARGAVSLLSAFKIDFLSFGCETDNAALLEKAAWSVDLPQVGEKVKALISNGTTYPSALQQAVCDLMGEETASVLSSPNNTLAIEYIRQKEKLCADFGLLPVKRFASIHDESVPTHETVTSASALRMMNYTEQMKPFVPDVMFKELSSFQQSGLFPCKIENAERAVIAFLRGMTLEEMKRYVPDENGLAERIYSKSRFAETPFELVKAVKVKSITEAMIRRAVMQCFLKIPKEIALGNPPYIKILAANKKGFEVLKEKNPSLPIVTKKADADKLLPEGKAIYDLECECTDKFSLFSKKISGCFREQTSPIVII